MFLVRAEIEPEEGESVKLIGIVTRPWKQRSKFPAEGGDATMSVARSNALVDQILSATENRMPVTCRVERKGGAKEKRN